VKTSAELLREYSSMIKEDEDDFDASDFNENEPDDFEEMNRNEADDYRNESSSDMDNDDNPVSKLVDYLDAETNNEFDFTTLISQFMKENNYELVPTNSLENSTGNV